MIYKEEQGDLFELHPDYWLCQCISADFGMGKGIAVEFNKHFDQKNRMKNKFGVEYLIHWDSLRAKGDAIIDPPMKVINLITKTNYWYKPTYEVFTNALMAMKSFVIEYGITKLAMPKIGCGLDRLEWEKVRKIIKEVFADVDIEIVVRYLK